MQRRSRWQRPSARQVWVGVAALMLGIIVFQFIYPHSRLLPGTTIHATSYSGWDKTDARYALQQRYQDDEVAVFLADNTKATTKNTWSELGLKIDSKPEVAAYTYPWFMRLIPTSVMWYGKVSHANESKVSWKEAVQENYIDDLVGKDCRIKPINAGIEADGKKVKATEAVDGGTCQRKEVNEVFTEARPSLSDSASITVPVKSIAPTIDTKTAEKLAETINKNLKKGVMARAGEAKVALGADKIAPLIRSRVKDKKFVITIDAIKSEKYLTQKLAKHVSQDPGTTYVKTHDFTEVSRKDGVSGKKLDVAATGGAISQYLMGDNKTVTAKVRTIAPQVEYTRTYSKTDKGLSALIKNYASDNKGTFGVQLIELSGKRRRASHNANKTFTTASTYKLYVAYGTLKKVEAGSWKWSDRISDGRDLATCFDDMIARSDNPCSEVLLEKLGFAKLTSQINKLGLKNSSFLVGDHPTTTAGDLATFMAMLESRQLSLKKASYDRFLSALKQNVYREGIPAGAGSATVADKVGFLDKLLHDSAVVYSPKGTYALAIMTDGSSWGKIAELTKEIEALR